MITADQLKIEELRLRYLELIGRPEVFPTRANWRFITANRMRGLARGLYGKYLTALTIDEVDRQELHDVAIEEFPEYIKSIDRCEAVEAVYSDIYTAPDATCGLIRDAGLFDALEIMRLVEDGDLAMAFRLLTAYKSEYDATDLAPMQRLVDMLENRTPTGGIREHRGIFGVSEKYICPSGHTNPPDTEYCTHSGCGLDARGYTREQAEAITTLSRRTDALRELLNEHADQVIPR